MDEAIGAILVLIILIAFFVAIGFIFGVMIA